MKKRTKIISAMTACLIAVCLLAVGFAKWSTDITISGSVSAEGSWDVKVTAAELELSDGAALASSELAELTAYNAYIIENNKGKDILSIDISNPYTVSLTAEEVADYSAYTYYNKSWASSLSSSVGSNYFYYVGTASEVTSLFGGSAYVYAYLTVDCTVDKSAVVSGYEGEDGALVGYVIKAADIINAVYETVESETTYTDTTVSFADVIFSLPGAWASYTVTITNEGTADANLADYTFDFSGLDEDVYIVSTPEIADDSVIEPGQSATLVFTVQVDPDYAENTLSAEAESFTVTLSYAADTVEETVPDAGYTVE